MNTKLQNFYKKLFEFCATDYITERKTTISFFKFCCNYDFAVACDLWEFVVLENESKLTNPDTAIALSDAIYEIFYEKSPTKTTKLVMENAAIKRALFLYSPLACQGQSFDLVVDLLLTNKLAAIDDIFKNLLKNNASKPYGQLLKEVVEKLLIELMKKATQAGKKIDMPKKTSTLLLSHIAKIKGAERPLLEQRIKEIY